MGWDAFAGDNVARTGVTDPAILADFAKAADKVVLDYYYADGYLAHGGLDVSTCGEYLVRATGLSVYAKAGWSPLEVKGAEIVANWKFRAKWHEAWAKASARAFLTVCARHGLGIWFSW